MPDNTFELPPSSGNPGNDGKTRGLSKTFYGEYYKQGEPRSNTASADKTVAAFWNAQALVKQSTPDKIVTAFWNAQALVKQSTPDTSYMPTAQRILRAVDLSQLNNRALLHQQYRVPDILRTIGDALASSRIQEPRRKIDANDALAKLYLDDSSDMREFKIQMNVSRALKLLGEFDKLTREARGEKEYEQYCESSHVDTDSYEKSRLQSFIYIEHQMGQQIRNSMIKKMSFSSEGEELAIDHDARLRETWKLFVKRHLFLPPALPHGRILPGKGVCLMDNLTSSHLNSSISAF